MPWILKPQSDPDLKPQKWGKNRHGFIIEEKKMQISVKRTDLEPNQYARIDRWIATKIEPLKPRNWGKVTIFTDSIGTYTERQQIRSEQIKSNPLSVMNEMQEIPPLFQVGGKRVLGGFLTFVNVFIVSRVEENEGADECENPTPSWIRNYFSVWFLCPFATAIVDSSPSSRLIIIRVGIRRVYIQILIKIKCITLHDRRQT